MDVVVGPRGNSKNTPENFAGVSSIYHPLHHAQDMQRLLLRAIVTLKFDSPRLRVLNLRHPHKKAFRTS